MFNLKSFTLLWVFAWSYYSVDSAFLVDTLTEQLFLQINERNLTGVKNVIEKAKNGGIRIPIFINRKLGKDNLYLNNFNHALHCATYKNNLEMVKFLVEQGADVNTRSNYDDSDLHSTPLEIAALNDNLKIVDYLLEKGALTCVEGSIMSPLHFAARNNNTEMVNLILKFKGNVDILNKHGCTPLHDAITLVNVEIASKLLRAGANGNLVEKPRSSGFHALAKVEAHIDIEPMVKLLLKNGVNIEGKDNLERKPVQCAIGDRNFKTARVFIKNGARIDNKCVGKSSGDVAPLYDVVKNGDVEMASMFLKAGAEVNETNGKMDESALHAVAKAAQNSEFLVTLLLKHGAYLEQTSGDGKTPLYRAIEEGNVEVATALLKAGANVTATNGKKEYCAIHAAVTASKNLEPIITLLLKHGANIEQKSRDGKTPMCIAVEKCIIEAEKVFLQHGALPCKI